ncbi:alcohol dehydrogenase [candidate division TA06 bacterium DG_26]|uniref:alcohol dehydrogenase n=1 Tax=candidate division TA06 bacterium DG_26 TaxID=1703771 RepID=A0A0S7WHL6_UNCT6|nr:MAG: alcohol dehydrogenase [candidate division TA06 bacterium DG_26]
MKAMVLNKPGPIEENPLNLEDVERPEPREGEILVRLKACGICHTDLHTVEGELDLPKLPLIPGHQIIGLVEALGPEASTFKKGDRVGVPWLYCTCGECHYCKMDLENLCLSAQFTGYHVDGGYAEYAAAKDAFAYPIPEGFTDRAAAPLLCAGIIGFRALRLCEVKPGQRLGLYGFGASAHVTIQIARHWGCEVYVFTRSKDHQNLADELGAAWVGKAEDTPPNSIQGAIIFAPVGHLALDALRVMDKGATLALAGIYMTPVPEIDYKLLYDERTIRSVTASTREDARELLRYAGEIPIETEVQEFPLEDANKALQMLKRSEIKGAGVLKIGTD